MLLPRARDPNPDTPHPPGGRSRNSARAARDGPHHKTFLRESRAKEALMRATWASGSQLYVLNKLGLLKKREQWRFDEAEAELESARAAGRWDGRHKASMRPKRRLRTVR